MEVGIGFERKRYENGETVFEIYMINHFGAEKIPPRPAVTMAIEQISKEQMKYTEAFIRNLANSKPSDRDTIKTRYLTQMGRMIVKRCKDIIDSGEQLQHNAPRTVAEKGFDQPLYETGLMQDSLAYEVKL